jgi:lipopolysaccharide export system protein LptA
MFRRARWLLLLAILLLSVAVAAIFLLRREDLSRHRPKPSQPLPANTSATADMWEWEVRKNDVQVRMRARSFRQIHEPSTVLLSGMQMEIRNTAAGTYDLINSAEANFDTGGGQLYADGAVEIRLRLPISGEAPAKKMIIHSSGVHYDSKSQRAWTERHATIEFDGGEGEGEGASYDPGVHTIELNSAVKMHWTGKGGGAPMDLNASHAIYHEQDQRVELRAPVKLKRGTLSVDGGDTLVELAEGKIETVETSPAQGVDELPTRRVDFSAQRMKMWFDDADLIHRIEGVDSARVVSKDANGETVMTGSRLDLDFVAVRRESQLSHAVATGQGRVESHPAPRARSADKDAGKDQGKDGGRDKAPSQSGPKVLTSEKLELNMKPGGQEIDQARTLAPGRLEFLPVKPGDRTRQLDAERMTVWYGPQNIMRDFRATKAATKTETPARPVRGGQPKPPTITLTRSRELEAQFDARGQVTTIDQRGDFEYEEETRRAKSDTAQMDETTGVILLRGQARAWDETGSTDAEEIRIDQKSGTTIAKGRVSSTRLPDHKESKDAKSQKDNKGAGDGGLIAGDLPLMARAAEMTTWDKNQKIRYTGDAVLWQGSTRIQGREIFIDREAQRLEAHGDVVTRVVDSSPSGSPDGSAAAQPGQTQPGQTKQSPAPVTPRGFSVVSAPEFTYDGKIKQGFYRENAHLERTGLDVRSRYLKTFFEEVPKRGGGTETQLEHLEADGAVDILQKPPGHVRRGRGEHAEYYLGEERMVLSGGQPEVTDPQRGTTRGPKITWYSREDRMLVETLETKERVLSRTMKDKKK